MLDQCLASVIDGEPMFMQHLARVYHIKNDI